VSRQAVAYVQQAQITDATAKQVFMALAERTRTRDDPHRPDEIPDIMGIELSEADIPSLAARAGLDAAAFREQLRALKQHVRIDVLEHDDGVWEIVYGPSYTRLSSPRPAAPDTTQGGPHAFWMPGWEDYSTWGYDGAPGDQHLYAQIIHNKDDPDAEPRIWITPPRHVVRTVDELAAVIAEAMSGYGPVAPPALEVKRWLTAPPLP
jgi:hypothetical protein